MGNCVCVLGWIDPETNKEIRGVLAETRGTIRDARTYAKEKKPQVEVRACVASRLAMEERGAHLFCCCSQAAGQKVAESAKEAARQAGPVAEELKATAKEALPDTPPLKEGIGKRGSGTPISPPSSAESSGRPAVYSSV